MRVQAGEKRSSFGPVQLLWAGYLGMVVYWMVRLWGHFPLFLDSVEYVFPEKWINVESFRNGRIPLLNPYLAAGSPHLAALQPAVFYPFFWFWNWTGLTDWFFVLALLHGVLASVGFYLWLRSLKVHTMAASLCAISFGGSAFLTIYWGFPTHLASVAWVPWIFWASKELQGTKSWIRWSALCAFWSFQILAGYPFFTFYAFLFWVFCLWRWKTKGLSLLVPASAFAAALGVTACQWLPFVDFLGYLHRAGAGGEAFNLNWSNYLTLLQPHLLGTPGTAAYRGDYPDFIFNNFYLGLVPLAFFIYSFFPGAPWRNAFWKWTSLFFLLWPAGSHFLPWRVIPHALLDKVEPATATFLFLFCALTTVGTGLQERSEFSPKGSKIKMGAWVLGVVWVLDLLWNPVRMIQLVPDPYRDPGVIQTAGLARQWTGEGRMLSLPDKRRLYSSQVVTPADALRERVQELYPNTNQVFGLKEAHGYFSIGVDGSQNVTKYLEGYFPAGRVLDLLGTKLISFPEPLRGFKYQVREPVGPTLFARNAGALGHAWVVDQVRSFPSRAAAFSTLLDPKVFPEAELYTDQTSEGKATVLPPADRKLEAYGGATFWRKLRTWMTGETTYNKPRETKPSPCEDQLMVSAPKGGFLVLDEAYIPGWRVWVDGEPKSIFRAYGLLMAAPLSAGDHRVVFRYEPTAVRVGLFLSLLVLAGLALGTGLNYRKRKI